MVFEGTMISNSGWQKLLWKAFGGMGLRAFSKAMETDLDDIAAAAEKPA